MKRFLCGPALLAAIMMAPSVASQMQPLSPSSTSTRAKQTPTTRILVVGVPNLYQVSPRLYRGGQPTPEGLQALSRMGIGIVVDGRKFDKKERDQVSRLGMRYVSIPWHCPFPKDIVFARFLALIRENPDKKIFVHCRLGDDRVGMMIASYRMAEEGWTAQQAMEEMKRDGFTLSHHLICPGLAHYEMHFPERYRTHRIFRSIR
jgi:protein tyrosine phosphatase (PTP) superfamily phosphohydrolase (DUF442 family)